MLGLFRPLEEYVGPSSSIMDALRYFILFGYGLTFSLEFVYLPFAERDISTVV
jgi:hypothetical protein